MWKRCFSVVSAGKTELVELDAVLEGCPCTHVKALVQLSINIYPGVLAVHFLDNLVQLRWCFAFDKAVAQLIGLQGLRPCKLMGGLQLFLDHRELLLLLIFLSFCLDIFGSLEVRLNCFLSSKTASNAFSTSWTVPFCSRRQLTAMMWTRYSLLFPWSNADIWKLVPSGNLTLICFVSPLSCRSIWGTYRIGGRMVSIPFLHSKSFCPLGGDLWFTLCHPDLKRETASFPHSLSDSQSCKGTCCLVLSSHLSRRMRCCHRWQQQWVQLYQTHHRTCSMVLCRPLMPGMRSSASSYCGVVSMAAALALPRGREGGSWSQHPSHPAGAEIGSRRSVEL